MTHPTSHLKLVLIPYPTLHSRVRRISPKTSPKDIPGSPFLPAFTPDSSGPAAVYGSGTAIEVAGRVGLGLFDRLVKYMKRRKLDMPLDRKVGVKVPPVWRRKVVGAVVI